MNATDWIVVAGGIAAIVWVNWYFLFAERSAVTVAATAVSAAGEATSASTIAEVAVTVRGGYNPATIRVATGQPVRLVFDRQETSSCSEEVVFPDFGIRRFLPAGTKTTIEVTPTKPGRYEFACGMGMLHGVLIAEGESNERD
jgi:plastocyanin domain-containing protein